MAKHLTPDERARVAARYIETANASAVAREFGISEGAVRKVIGSSRARKNELHAQACAAAIRKARRSLAKRVDTIEAYLAHATQDGVVELEPRDFAAVVNAQCAVTARLYDAQERIERSRQAQLTREKTRAEIALLEAKARGDVVETVVVAQQDAARIAREVFGSPSALERKTHVGPSPPSDGAVAGDFLSVPAGMAE